ncbi:DUF1156 domain-containing protein [Halobellus marinus]|uniref:DUF1156 domain-containing protein n=1 Tax=Halobellus TaxID=1073986 RepID=UPI0028A7FED8|nr:DUF1156 domain-containing protein [Halobellus sp. DFY28]
MPDSNGSRSDLPIERGFPIEQVNDLADREGRAKLHYRPLTTMHKWWARRLGSVFRAISLYSLVSDPDRVTVRDPDEKDHDLTDFDETSGDADTVDVSEMIENVDLANSDAMWELYSKDIRVEDTDVLDPFMGGGTSLLEAIRFDADVTGVDLNPVAWFITKKELEAHTVDPEALRDAFENVQDAVAEELQSQYKTACPNDESHVADVVYAFWVRELDCTSCGETVPLFKDYRVAKGRYENSDRYHVYCPDCGNVFLTDDYQTETVCSDCGNEYVPENGPVSRGGNYGCPSCGLKYPIVDAIADGQSYAESLYALEYYCTECEDEGRDRPTYKGYKRARDEDVKRFEQAADSWESENALADYVPQGDIPEGAITTSSSISGNDVFRHGYESWEDMFNDRQLYCLSTLLRSIDEEVDDQTVKEYLLLAFSDSLMFQNNFSIYNVNGNKIEGIFRQNSFTPEVEYTENNVWGTRAGRGTFRNTWDKVVDAVEFAQSPTERYIENGETEETAPFEKPVGGEYTIHQGDLHDVDLESEYDAIITDPPYYDNVVYSEVSDFFYVWQRLLLGDEYEGFTPETTPREESIVANPAEGMDSDSFESKLRSAFSRMRDVLSDDGVLVFTYRHGDEDTWGALLESLCDEGFDVTATYPISANLSEFVVGDELNFSVVVVARPATDREPISWSSLRRRAHRAASETREKIQAGQTLSEGDISIVEMGRCFREYSNHHGKVHRGGTVMSATEIVSEIYDIISGNVTPDEIYLDLLEMDEPTLDDVTRFCRGTDIDPDDLRRRGLFVTDDGFELTDWRTEERIEYLRGRSTEELTPLEGVQLLRYRDAQDVKPPDEQRDLDVTSEMIDVAEELARLTGDEGYEALF